MEDSRIDFPEVAGKTITELCAYDDPAYGREILVHFTDKTELSICVGVKQTIDARYCHDDAPDQPLSSHKD